MISKSRSVSRLSVPVRRAWVSQRTSASKKQGTTTDKSDTIMLRDHGTDVFAPTVRGSRSRRRTRVSVPGATSTEPYRYSAVADGRIAWCAPRSRVHREAGRRACRRLTRLGPAASCWTQTDQAATPRARRPARAYHRRSVVRVRGQSPCAHFSAAFSCWPPPVSPPSRNATPCGRQPP